MVYNTVHTPLKFRRVGSYSYILNWRSHDHALSATGDGAAHTLTDDLLPPMCIGIQKYVRNDFKGVLFLYVTVNFDPYGNVQITLLCNKTF
jgi:hypothetical protein